MSHKNCNIARLSYRPLFFLAELERSLLLDLEDFLFPSDLLWLDFFFFTSWSLAKPLSLLERFFWRDLDLERDLCLLFSRDLDLCLFLPDEGFFFLSLLCDLLLLLVRFFSSKSFFLLELKCSKITPHILQRKLCKKTWEECYVTFLTYLEESFDRSCSSICLDIIWS